MTDTSRRKCDSNCEMLWHVARGTFRPTHPTLSAPRVINSLRIPSSILSGQDEVETLLSSTRAVETSDKKIRD